MKCPNQLPKLQGKTSKIQAKFTGKSCTKISSEFTNGPWATTPLDQLVLIHRFECLSWYFLFCEFYFFSLMFLNIPKIIHLAHMFKTHMKNVSKRSQSPQKFDSLLRYKTKAESAFSAQSPACSQCRLNSELHYLPCLLSSWARSKAVVIERRVFALRASGSHMVTHFAVLFVSV